VGAVAPGCSAAGKGGVIIIILHFIKVKSVSLGQHHGLAQNFGRRLCLCGNLIIGCLANSR